MSPRSYHRLSHVSPPAPPVASKKSDRSSERSSVSALRSGKSSAGSSGSGVSVWENVKAVLVTVAIFLAIRTFLIEAYRIPSGSMIPTLLVGDWLFVNKLAYGPHVPFTNINLPGYDEPERGDVVVFVSPNQIDQPEDPNPTLVKRLVAVAGDTIWMRGALLHVNGMPQRQGFAAQQNPRGDGGFSHPLFAWQHQFEVRGTAGGDPPASPTLDDWGPLVVPEGHLFMLGDNRYDSKDGRYWGMVPRENVRGRPVFVYYSYNAQDSDRPLPFLTDIRWGRIGDVIR
ncbi:MAG TPA: signal peptidase I [Gemmatimonas aurantiaca]|uniref:Signal peptidase I n=1 Tax=Gemmatimonas aurantiaca TaxID=173480 RepID=A0A3D4V9U6_9BACT|nr:signal peptidase I [Gemmatimonas aurantiaca]